MKFGATDDEDPFAQEMHKHVMRDTVQAEARQQHNSSKQQPTKQAAQEKERKSEGKVVREGRRKRLERKS